MANFLCIKWGTKYDSSYVNRLYAGIKKYVPSDFSFRFVCLTDDSDGIIDTVEIYPLPKTPFDEAAFDAKAGGETWRKVGVFQPNLANLVGDTVFLDLDVVIMGDVSALFGYAPDTFVVIQDWLEKRRAAYIPWRHGRVGNTSVFRFNPQIHHTVYTDFIDNHRWALDRFRIEQQYVSWALQECTTFWPVQWMQSFKRSCRPIFPLNHIRTPYEPKGAKILVFHGYPLPEQAMDGYNGGILKSTKPTPWLQKYWDI